MIRIGLISDTHGLLRPEAMAFLQGSDVIVHAGDIGNASILAALEAIAPVTAVRGNNDRGEWAQKIGEREFLRVGELTLHVLHDLAQLDIDPAVGGIQAVVSGHSHRPVIERRAGVVFINPGSAGPRRFRLPISVGDILVDGTSMRPRTVELVVPTAS